MILTGKNKKYQVLQRKMPGSNLLRDCIMAFGGGIIAPSASLSATWAKRFSTSTPKRLQLSLP